MITSSRKLLEGHKHHPMGIHITSKYPSLLLTRSGEREVLAVGSIPVALLPSGSEQHEVLLSGSI